MVWAFGYISISMNTGILTWVLEIPKKMETTFSVFDPHLILVRARFAAVNTPSSPIPTREFKVPSLWFRSPSRTKTIPSITWAPLYCYSYLSQERKLNLTPSKQVDQGNFKLFESKIVVRSPETVLPRSSCWSGWKWIRDRIVWFSLVDPRWSCRCPLL